MGRKLVLMYFFLASDGHCISFYYLLYFCKNSNVQDQPQSDAGNNIVSCQKLEQLSMFFLFVSVSVQSTHNFSSLFLSSCNTSLDTLTSQDFETASVPKLKRLQKGTQQSHKCSSNAIDLGSGCLFLVRSKSFLKILWMRQIQAAGFSQEECVVPLWVDRARFLLTASFTSRQPSQDNQIWQNIQKTQIH